MRQPSNNNLHLMKFYNLLLYLLTINRMRYFLITILSLIIAGSASGQQRIDSALAQADSLFQAGKYTESFKLYDHILNAEQQVSPAMLLRMSFIKEGLGNFTEALYYLNLYYLQTSERNALNKMEELAENRGLEGYEYSDWEFIQTVFYKYFFHITGTLLALAVLILSIMFYQKFRLKQQPIAGAVMLVLVLGLLFYTLNYGKAYSKALINANNTYIMSGPSAGAEVISIVDKGHRVEIEGKEDVWAQVTWKGNTAYIKIDKLKPVDF